METSSTAPGAPAHDLVEPRDARGAAQVSLSVSRRGKRDAQGQTAVAVARGHDVSAVGFDDGTIDGQSHTEPIGLARYEGLEYALELRSSHAGAGIGNGDLDKPRRRLRRLDPQHPGCVHDVGQGLTRVDEQVEHDLLELDGIPE